MEETRDQQRLHGFLQCCIYFSVALEAAIFLYNGAPGAKPAKINANENRRLFYDHALHFLRLYDPASHSGQSYELFIMGFGTWVLFFWAWNRRLKKKPPRRASAGLKNTCAQKSP